MYDSIKDWLNVDLVIRQFIKRDGAGDKTFKEPITVASYPVFETKLVRNSLGVDVSTSHHYYVNGNVIVSVLDEVRVDDKWLPIQAIDVFYRDGLPDIKVVHA